MRPLIILVGMVHGLCLGALAEDRLWTHAEILADVANPKYDPVNFPESPRTCKLTRMTEEAWSSDPNKGWIVTKHADIRVAVYARQAGGYRLERVLLRNNTDDTFFEDPKWIGVSSETYGGKSSHQVKLFTVTEVWFGTGQLTRHHVFAEHKDRLIPVKWVSPVETLPWRLLEGQAVWKGIGMASKAATEGSDSTVEFGFYVWNKGDGNCCPTGGRVCGELGLFDRGAQPNGEPILELRAKSYRWEPSEQTDLLSFGATRKTPDNSSDSKPSPSPQK